MGAPKEAEREREINLEWIRQLADTNQSALAPESRLDGGARRVAKHRAAALVGHDGGRLAYGGRLEAERKLEPAQLPMLVGGHQNVARV